MPVAPQALQAAAASAAAAILTVAGLSLLARPGQAEARLANVTAVAARVQQGTAEREPLLAAPCRTNVSTAENEAKVSLQTMAAQAGVTLEALGFADVPVATSDLHGGRVVVRLRGDEAAFAKFLRQASEARMPIFLDVADVRRTPNGGLFAELDGRLLCRRSGR